MIQRKQTLWLLFASLLGAGVFLFDLYRGEINVGEVTEHKILRVSDHYPSVLIGLVMAILPFVTIFMFGNRKRQMRMTAAAILAAASFMTMMLSRVTGLSKLTPPVTGGSYWIGAVLPVLAIVFLVLAILGIRSDEKLVRSTDRLR
jgi:uncharacterized membrane protein